MNLFFCEHIQQPVSFLSEDESKHCVRVMRMQAGQPIYLMDGKGHHAIGKIKVADKRKVQIEVESIQQEEQSVNGIHIAIVPTKSNDRIEWFLEKATELNVNKISFIKSQNSERTKIKIDRYKKVVLSAAKQSLSYYLPKLSDLMPLDQFFQATQNFSNKYVATLHKNENHFKAFQNNVSDKIVLIGPEGGFTKNEVEKAIAMNFKPITLGEKRLRTETAGILAATVQYLQSI